MLTNETWTMLVYVDDRRRTAIEKWSLGFSQTAKSILDRRLMYLSATRCWGRPHASKLRGYSKLWEIRFENMRVQYRPLGFFGPGRKEFTILIGAYERDGKFDPLNAPKIAEKLMVKVLNDRSRRHVTEYE